MKECKRMNGVHPDATKPELYESRRPRACKEHIMREMKNNRETFKANMDKMQSAKATLDMKIKDMKVITDESREEIHEAMNEFQDAMKHPEEPENNCKPPSLFLAEFEKEFADEPCPYIKD